MRRGDRFVNVFATAAVVTAIGIIAWGFFPGYTNPDTLSILDQARTGAINDWHTPVVSAFWRLLGGGFWLVGASFLLNLTAVSVLMHRLFALSGFSYAAACVATILTCYTPPILSILSVVGKDNWVAGLFLCAIYLTICYHQRNLWFFLILRYLALILAILVRPDFSFISILFLCLESLFSDGNLPKRARRCVLGIATVILGYFGINYAVNTIDHVKKVHPETFLFVSDLIDLSVSENRLVIPEAYLDDIDLKTIRAKYVYPDVNLVFFGPPPNVSLDSSSIEQFSSLKKVWVDSLERAPFRFAKHRWDIFILYLRNQDYVPQFVVPNEQSLQIRHVTSNLMFLRYLTSFTHGILQRHFVTLFGCLALICLMSLNGPPADIQRWLTVGLICSFVYQVIFSVIGFPPYWRFASAGVLFFWICFYIAAGYGCARFLKKKAASVIRD
jgi:hypothetical protein